MSKKYKITIGGHETSLTWSQEAAKRYAYRLSSIGGHPNEVELSNPATASAAVCKLVWALLPSKDISRYPTPEDLFVALDQESEAIDIAKALSAVYEDMSPPAEKKSAIKKSSKKSPSRKSNSV